MSTEQLSTVTIEKKITVNRQFYHTIETLLTGGSHIHCVVLKHIQPPPPDPPEGTFVLALPLPLDFPFHGCLLYPLPPGISVIFHFGWVPPGKNTFVKNVVALYFYARDNLR